MGGKTIATVAERSVVSLREMAIAAYRTEQQALGERWFRSDVLPELAAMFGPDWVQPGVLKVVEVSSEREVLFSIDNILFAATGTAEGGTIVRHLDSGRVVDSLVALGRILSE